MLHLEEMEILTRPFVMLSGESLTISNTVLTRQHTSRQVLYGHKYYRVVDGKLTMMPTFTQNITHPEILHSLHTVEGK